MRLGYGLGGIRVVWVFYWYMYLGRFNGPRCLFVGTERKIKWDKVMTDFQ